MGKSSVSGGWIKLEKSVESDPRVLRLAKELKRLCNAEALPGVTLAVGALARLWIFADSHIREDDTIDVCPQDLDDWIGIPGFCEAMPDDWLRIVDENTVELPGFQEHNGVGAKKRALTQKRVAQHRSKKKRQSVTGCNANALPDQDLDQDLDPKSAYARARVSESDGHAEFQRIMADYPKGTGRQDWLMAEYHCVRLVDEGCATWDELRAAVERYAAYVAAGGVSSAMYVMNPANFFGTHDQPWKREWKVPDAASKPGSKPSLEERSRAKTEEWLRQFDDADSRAGASGGGGLAPVHRNLRGSVDEGSRRTAARDADGRVGAVVVAADAGEPDSRGSCAGVRVADPAGGTLAAEPERVLRAVPPEAGGSEVSRPADRSAPRVAAADGKRGAP